MTKTASTVYPQLTGSRRPVINFCQHVISLPLPPYPPLPRLPARPAPLLRRGNIGLDNGVHLSRLPNNVSRTKHFDKINSGKLSIDAKDLKHIVNLYDAEILSMDSAFASFIAFLKKESLYANSVIIFTSDHGEEFGEHGMVGRHDHSLYDELLKVPLIIKFANSEFKGKSIKEQTRNIDILPTLLDYLSIQHSPLGGVSLMSWIKDDARREKLPAVSQRDIQNFASVSLREPIWKWYDGRVFNLSLDPGEKTDLSAQRKDVGRDLRMKLDQILNDVPINESRVIGKKIIINEKIREQLKALGYIQ